ncbi:RHS repeat-associated core domain-containing protein [Candidatus Protochlamydia phocaeensis]|uniref:RHS repeat-associated core domain-containing protein n=1 Tax=Candidatus Protochlamydia phocaeensis TaxID=1414722 RepID=UPI0018968485|nr:RHS repeat-associated core domain-containing protein [Candidatus Protochlamydia phocaeensis]
MFSISALDQDIRLTAECEPIATVADCVNVISGDYFEVNNDISIDNVESLNLNRYYDSGHLFSSVLGFGFGSNFPFNALEPQKQDKHHYALIEEREGFSIPYRSREGLYSTYRIDKRLLEKGYTNLSRPGLSSHTNVASTQGVFDKEGWKIKLGNGSQRTYQMYERIKNLSTGEEHCFYDLQEETRPSGNRVKFSYANINGEHCPLKIWLTDATGKTIFSEINFHYSSDYVLVKSNRGDEVYYLREKEKHTIKSSSESSFQTNFFLKHVHSPQHTPVSYHLTDDSKKGALKIGKVTKPDGRFLKIKYDDERKVKSLIAPVGPNAEEMAFYQFIYKKNETLVLDALHQLTAYQFCRNKRLTSICYYDTGLQSQSQKNKLLKEERFSWTTGEGKEGWLSSKEIVNSSGQIVQKFTYQYDSRGNCTREKLKGNLTGAGPEAFTESDELSGFVESYEKSYQYSKDGFNLLIKESTPEGVEIEYIYKPGTNQLIGKFVSYGGKIQERTFHYYHPYGVLIQTIEDDGSSYDHFDLTDVTVRHVKQIEIDLQSRSPSLGKPTSIRECYQNHDTAWNLVDLKTTAFTYNARGLAVSEKIYDANHQFRYELKTEYDCKDRIVSKTDPLNRLIVYAYDDNDNKISEEMIGSGKKTLYFYDKANRLTKKEEHHPADGLIFCHSYTYDALSRLISEQDFYGQVTQYAYDRLGRQISWVKPAVVNQDGQGIHPTITRKYNLLNQIVEETDENNHTTKTSYTVYGKPICIAHPDGAIERFLYYPNGLLKQAWQADGGSRRYTYDAKGQLTKEEVLDIQGNLVQQESYVYKGPRLYSYTDPMGVMTCYKYDGAGRKIGEATQGRCITYHYDALGRLEKIIHHGEDGQQQVEAKEYDLLDRVLSKQQIDETGQVFAKETFAYDIHGNCIQHRIYQNQDMYALEETCYYSWGVPKWQKDALGQLTLYCYDYQHWNLLGQAVLKRTVIEPSGCQTVEVHDALSHVVQKDIYFPNLIASTLFAYDAKGNLTQQKEAVIKNGIIERYYTLEWSYNNRDWVEKLTEKPALKTLCYQYDGLGRVVAKTKPNGTILSYQYDVLGHLVSLYSSDGSFSYSYQYDLHGNLIGMADAIRQRQQKRTYDCFNRLIEEDFGNQIILRYGYDAFDRINHIILPDGSSIRYDYNAFHIKKIERLNKEQQSLYACLTMRYDWAGRLLAQRLPFNLGQIDYRFDVLGRPLSIESPHWNQFIQGYDASSNLLADHIMDPAGEWSEHFKYDGLNQLIAEAGLLTNDYVYDSLHNRREYNGHHHEVNALNQLLKDAASEYQYDPNGNLIGQTFPSIIYAYDGLDRLSSLTKEGITTRFIYDGLGRCLEIQEDSSSCYLLYQGEQEIGSWENDQLKNLRIIDPEEDSRPVFALELDRQVYFPVQDHRRNICCLLSIDGSEKWYRYSAFGECEESQGQSLANPWRFAGKRKVGDLVYFGNRFYSPAMGKWINPDPLGFEDGPNLYAYVHNNPLMHVDWLGLFDLDLTHMSFSERMQALDFESFAAQADFSSRLHTSYFFKGLGQGMGNGFASPIDTATKQYGGAVDVLNGDFGKHFSGMDRFAMAQEAGVWAGETVMTAVNAINVGRLLYSAARGTSQILCNQAAKAFAKQGNKQLLGHSSKVLSQTTEVAATVPDFIVGSNGVAIPTSRKVLEAGFQRAGFETFATESPGIGYILSNKMKVRIMNSSGKAPVRASFTNANQGPINPFTGKPPQPPKGLSKTERLNFTRTYSHLELQ